MTKEVKGACVKAEQTKAERVHLGSGQPKQERDQCREVRTELALATRAHRKMRGLLFTSPNEKALLLMACNDVHTVGMRHALDVAFVDDAGKVVEAHRSVGPLRRLRNGRAVAVIERFASCDTPWFSAGDQIVLGKGKGVSA